jgi:hypothetical protein
MLELVPVMIRASTHKNFKFSNFQSTAFRVSYHDETQAIVSIDHRLLKWPKLTPCSIFTSASELTQTVSAL